MITAASTRNAPPWIRASIAIKYEARRAPLNFDQDPAVQEDTLSATSSPQFAAGNVPGLLDRASGAKECRVGWTRSITDVAVAPSMMIVVWRFHRFARSVKQLACP